MWSPRAYCSRCKKWKLRTEFFEREDRDAPFAFCRDCMAVTPVFVTLAIYPDEIVIVERTERSVDYPEVGERGFGKIE